MNIFKSLFFLFVILIFYSCTTGIDVDIPEPDDRIVIEGRVTDQNDYFKVIITKTLPLNNDKNKFVIFPVVNGAFVTISDNAGNIDTLFQQEDGYPYLTKDKKSGIAGRTYILNVRIDDMTYVAQDKLPTRVTIDSLYFNYLKPGEGLNIREAGYYLFYNFSDPPNEQNYYRYDQKVNHRSFDLKQAAVYNDQFLSQTIEGLRLPGKYNSGELGELNLYSISKPAYDYYVGLSMQLNNDGGFFTTPPANAPTNLSGGALGFFLVSSLSIDSLQIP